MKTPDTGKQLWFGYLPRMWARHGLTPLWVQVGRSDGWTSQRLRRALARFGVDGGPGLFPEGNALNVPLRLKTHAAEGAVVADLSRQLGDVVAAVDACPPIPADIAEVTSSLEFGE